MLYQFTTARRQVDSLSPQTKLIMQPQIQTWMTKNILTGDFTGYREPTNEEIQVQAALAIAHGADGICWFIYQSDLLPIEENPYEYRIGPGGPYTPTASDPFYMVGLLNLYPNSIPKRPITIIRINGNM